MNKKTKVFGFISKIGRMAFVVLIFAFIILLLTTVANLFGAIWSKDVSLKTIYNMSVFERSIILYLVIVIVIAFGMLINDVTESALKNRESKFYNVLQSIFFLCLAFLSIIGFLFFVWGVIRISHIDWLFVSFILVSAFVIYYSTKKYPNWKWKNKDIKDFFDIFNSSD